MLSKFCPVHFRKHKTRTLGNHSPPFIITASLRILKKVQWRPKGWTFDLNPIILNFILRVTPNDTKMPDLLQPSWARICSPWVTVRAFCNILKDAAIRNSEEVSIYSVYISERLCYLRHVSFSSQRVKKSEKTKVGSKWFISYHWKVSREVHLVWVLVSNLNKNKPVIPSKE